MLRDGRRLLRGIRTGHEGQVSIGASVAFEQTFFFDQVLAPYRRAPPGLLASVRFGPSVRLAEQVLDHGLDLAYAIGWQVPSGVGFEPQHDAEFALMVSRAHPLAARPSVTVDDFAGAGLITDVEWVDHENVLRELGLGGADVRLEVDGMSPGPIRLEPGRVCWACSVRRTRGWTTRPCVPCRWSARRRWSGGSAASQGRASHSGGARARRPNSAGRASRLSPAVRRRDPNSSGTGPDTRPATRD
jgi:hypothetical protein